MVIERQFRVPAGMQISYPSAPSAAQVVAVARSTPAYPMADWRSLYPFASRWFQLPPDASSGLPVGPRMHYVDELSDHKTEPGQASADRASDPSRSASKTVLCVHGNPTWSFYFREVVLLQRRHARAIAVDHVGCGLSDKPQDYRYDLDQHIANLVNFIRGLDLQRITLVVHDWGGAIGLGAALMVPERISGLVLLNTAAFPPPYIPLRIRACRIPVLGTWAMRSLNVFARAALTMTLHRLPRLPENVARGLIAPYDSWEHRIAIARFVADIPNRSDQPTWKRLAEIERRLPELAHLPAELVWGLRDWCFRPECLLRLQQLLPEAKVTPLEDVGHYVVEEAAAEVNAAIDRTLEAQPD